MKSFSPSQDTTRIGLVTKKLMPTAGWYLNSDRPGFTLLNALKVVFAVTPSGGVCICSMFCCALRYVPSSFAIILMGMLCLVCLPGVS